MKNLILVGRTYISQENKFYRVEEVSTQNELTTVTMVELESSDSNPKDSTPRICLLPEEFVKEEKMKLFNVLLDMEDTVRRYPVIEVMAEDVYESVQQINQEFCQHQTMAETWLDEKKFWMERGYGSL